MTDVDEMLAMLSDASTSSEALCDLLERLRRLAKRSDEERLELAAQGVLRALPPLARSEKGRNERIKERIVVLLVYMAKAEANRDAIREDGCLELLANELTSTHSVVLHNAMAALVNACIANSANANYMREEGKLKIIVELMDSKDAKTRHNACWLLKKLAASNPKNRDAMRELGVLQKIVPLLSSDEPAEVQEHSIALLAVLLDKHTRNRMTFKDLAGGPAAVSRLWERHQGSGKKVEEYAFKCVESLGGGKNLSDSSNGSVRRTDSGNGSLAPPSANRGATSPRADKSPRVDKPPRTPKNAPLTGAAAAAASAAASEKADKKKVSLFGKKKEKPKSDDGSKLSSSGRRSKDNEEIDEGFG